MPCEFPQAFNHKMARDVKRPYLQKYHGSEVTIFGGMKAL